MGAEGRHAHGFPETVTVAEALRRLAAVVPAIARTEPIALAAADGRVLAAPLTAPRDVPHHRRAAMDGFAVRAKDTFGAGADAPRTLAIGPAPAAGVALPVHTGSPVPQGFDAVVLVEDTERRGETVRVLRAVPEGANVAEAGEDVRRGERLFSAGHRLRPSDLGLAKTLGFGTVEVYARPRVAVLPTGEELVEDREPGLGEVLESNGFTLALSVARWGGDAAVEVVATDEPDRLEAALASARTADLVVTSGGSSVGERDRLPEVVAKMGRLLFHGVSLRPGHPVGAGVLSGGPPVLLLPGYPTACIVTAHLLLRPMVARLARLPETPPRTVPARLSRKVRSEVGIRQVVRVRLEGPPEDRVAEPTRTAGAGVLSRVTRADGFVVIPENVEGLDEGTVVEVEFWE
ncbi:MAG: molybdopterin molybdotransferase MoeA [Methanobacteriota archaeon]